MLTSADSPSLSVCTGTTPNGIYRVVTSFPVRKLVPTTNHTVPASLTTLGRTATKALFEILKSRAAWYSFQPLWNGIRLESLTGVLNKTRLTRNRPTTSFQNTTPQGFAAVTYKVRGTIRSCGL